MELVDKDMLDVRLQLDSWHVIGRETARNDDQVKKKEKSTHRVL